MRKATTIALIAVLLGTAGMAAAQEGSLRDRLRARMARSTDVRERAPAGTALSYGSDSAQTITYWKAGGGAARAPLILFVHGGGWKRGSADNATGAAKVGHFTAAGYALASINYRLVPDATVEQQAADVAGALAHLRSQAGQLGFDPNRIVLMGHSAGAHLVALVGTDPSYLRAAGLTPDTVRGVIALDGAAYDVPRQMAAAGAMMKQTYTQAFGTDPARQRALSPAFHAAAPNAPAFLILHVEREDGTAQSRELAAALTKAGTSAQIQSFAGKGLRGHMEMNRKLGQDDYPATAVVDRWLASHLKP